MQCRIINSTHFAHRDLYVSATKNLVYVAGAGSEAISKHSPLLLFSQPPFSQVSEKSKGEREREAGVTNGLATRLRLFRQLGQADERTGEGTRTERSELSKEKKGAKAEDETQLKVTMPFITYYEII